MPSRSKQAVPALLKQVLTDRIEELLDRKFRPGIAIQGEAAKRHGYNYIVELSTQWWGRYFYLVAKYRNPRSTAEVQFFEVKTTRLEYLGAQNFALSYMRHTGRWQEVYPLLNMEDCLDTIEQEELFWPMH